VVDNPAESVMPPPLAPAACPTVMEIDPDALPPEADPVVMSMRPDEPLVAVPVDTIMAPEFELAREASAVVIDTAPDVPPAAVAEPDNMEIRPPDNTENSTGQSTGFVKPVCPTMVKTWGDAHTGNTRRCTYRSVRPSQPQWTRNHQSRRFHLPSQQITSRLLRSWRFHWCSHHE
jgi:hypothetical protein